MSGFLSSFIDAVTGNDHTTETHDNGSYTDRYETGTSITYNSDDKVTEHSRGETFFGIPGTGQQVTYDGDGKVINVQSKG